ncbi:MAG: tRNA uridine-5-carboxymethylaminomethyl(34) synthesis GTPase MnmE [bacterium]|nr:tRNA uridine-5-carboxymethylaminomethyl(34) synthesis GTPase MnmE [bacterium]
MFRKETIAAIATGLSDSGIGIIRISGEEAVKVGNLIFRSPSGKNILQSAVSHRMYYGYAVNIGKFVSLEKNEWKNFIIDEVLAVVMKSPKSYTGEDIVEIQCHGGLFVMQKILSAALSAGARLAEPGEFTKRAFLNGKIDLTRAEAVMDVIHSQNELALAASVDHLTGSLYEKIKSLRGELIYEIAFIESALDDPEHISLEEYPKRLSKKLDVLLQDLKKMIETADNGRLIREGINTVIFGKPNVGKSSLMNLLLGEDRAIVTDIAGTTRDTLKESVRWGGIYLKITDTAGIRKAKDEVEKIGVEKAKKCAEDADLILFMLDASLPLDEMDLEAFSGLKGKKCIVLLNKCDLEGVLTDDDVKKMFCNLVPENKSFPMIKTCTKDGTGIEELEKTVKDLFFRGDLKLNHEIIITNTRHKEALQEAYESLCLVKKSVEDGMPEDFYSIDLMSAYASLGRIIGEEVDDDLVDEIFSKFCMGK